MHRLIEENLEEILNDGKADRSATEHLAGCEKCRGEVNAMRGHSALLREWRGSAEMEPRGGFYARVMERIENQGPVSVWNLFLESVFGRRLALASLALALLLGMYLVSTEPIGNQPEFALADDAVDILPVPVVTGQFVAMHDRAGVMSPGDPDDDSVLVNLVTYREQ
jgi:predicted anti-sigma-YlaC factor YlaD